jgi:PleD family two-component response regulator
VTSIRFAPTVTRLRHASRQPRPIFTSEDDSRLCAIIVSTRRANAKDDAVARVLVVEDDPMIRDLIDLTLCDVGHEVLLSDNGEAGIVMAREHDPDIILMDLMLPGIDGDVATLRLKT